METFFILSGILFWFLIIVLSAYVFISDYDYRKEMKKSEKKVEEWLKEQELKEMKPPRRDDYSGLNDYLKACQSYNKYIKYKVEETEY